MRKRLLALMQTCILAALVSVFVAGPVPVFSATTGVQIEFLLSQVRNATGSLAGGKVYFYSAGTTTAKDVYLDINKVAVAANPYTLDANGTALLYGDGTYRVVIKTAVGVTVYDRDNLKFEDLATDFINSEYTINLKPKSLTGNDTGNITGYDNITATTRVRAPSIGSASYTDNGYFLDVRTKGPWVDVRAYGVGLSLTNGTDDWAAAIQAAVDYAISLGGGTVYMPVGTYSISAPIIIGKFSSGAWTYSGVSLVGGKMPFYSSTDTPKSTKIVPTFSNTFAIGIQNGRGVHIRDILIVGTNDVESRINADITSIASNSTYTDGVARDTRYSPYAGIVVDPFGTSVPADGGYPGMSAYYVATAAGSSDIVFERVFVKGFVANIALSPNGTTANCSEISFWHCFLQYGKVGLSIGQSQSRSLNWYGGSNAYNLYQFDANTYGLQAGSAPNIYGCDMGGKYLFNLNNRYGGVFSAYGIHAESFMSIGFLSSTSSSGNEPQTFTASSFVFREFDVGLYPDRHLVSRGPVKFIGCSFDVANTSTRVFPLRFYHRAAANITFESCQFTNNSSSLSYEFPVAPIPSDSGIAFMDSIRFKDSYWGDVTSRGNGSGWSILSDFLVRPGSAYINKMVMASMTNIKLDSASKTYIAGGVDYYASLGTLAITDVGDGTATFTAADNGVVRVGDIVYTNSSVTVEKYDGTTESVGLLALGIVTIVNGTTVTIDGWPQSLGSASYASCYAFWWPRFHAATTGNTNSNTTVDNVAGVSAWAVGNKIMGAGITKGTYITDITDNTITLSKEASATAVGIRLYDADIYSVTGVAE